MKLELGCIVSNIIVFRTGMFIFGLQKKENCSTNQNSLCSTNKE